MKIFGRIGAGILAAGISAAMFITGCAGAPRTSKAALTLWNEGAPAKAALESYVAAVTDANSADFIPEAERVAVFDLDGTLCLETAPTYFDWQLFEHRVLDDEDYEAPEELREFAEAARRGEKPGLGADRERMVAQAYVGMTLDEFCSYVKAFMETDQPGFTNLKRGEAFYKPMVEVVDFLSANGFSVYVCSGSERFLVRALAGDALGLPPSRLIGSDCQIAAEAQGEEDGLSFTFGAGDRLVKGRSLVKNLQMNKVAVIAREIGVQPVLAFGNSSSDASMVNYAISGNKHRALAFMLCCDDLEREYGNQAKAEQMRADCEKFGWIPVSMRDDWKTIYGDGVEKTRLE